MTKAELLRMLEPFVDDVEIFVESQDGTRHLFGLRYTWPDATRSAVLELTLGAKKDDA